MSAIERRMTRALGRLVKSGRIASIGPGRLPLRKNNCRAGDHKTYPEDGEYPRDPDISLVKVNYALGRVQTELQAIRDADADIVGEFDGRVRFDSSPICQELCTRT
jgi:hypothetical protein